MFIIFLRISTPNSINVFTGEKLQLLKRKDKITYKLGVYMI